MVACGCSSDVEPGELYLQRLAGALDQSEPLLPADELPLQLFPLGDELFIKRVQTRLGVSNLLAAS